LLELSPPFSCFPPEDSTEPNIPPVLPLLLPPNNEDAVDDELVADGTVTEVVAVDGCSDSSRFLRFF